MKQSTQLKGKLAETGLGKTVPDVTGEKRSFYYDILNDICQESGIKILWLSNNWLAVLEKDDVRKLVMGHKFDLNSAVASATADDKYATFEVLRQAKLPIIQHALLYEPGNMAHFVEGRNSLDYIKNYLIEHSNHIVIKPNNGTCGTNVLQIRKPEEILPAIEKIFHQSYSASMCPFYEVLHEYRVVLLDEEARLVYKKERGEDWRFNLQKGARAVKVSDQALKENLGALAKRAAKALGLRFCSVDIIETTSREWLIMEVNSGVMIERYLRQNPAEYAKVRQIYADAVKKMFDAD